MNKLYYPLRSRLGLSAAIDFEESPTKGFAGIGQLKVWVCAFAFQRYAEIALNLLPEQWTLCSGHPVKDLPCNISLKVVWILQDVDNQSFVPVSISRRSEGAGVE